MGRRTKYRINLTTAEQTELERLIHQQTAPQHQVKRAKIILMANADGATNQAIAEQLGVYKAPQKTQRPVSGALPPGKREQTHL